MRQYLVHIPGTADAFTVFALSEDDALGEALRCHGLTFAPPGTTVIEITNLERA